MVEMDASVITLASIPLLHCTFLSITIKTIQLVGHNANQWITYLVARERMQSRVLQPGNQRLRTRLE